MLEFGKNGWVGTISEDFTFSNVKLISFTLADLLIKQAVGQKPVIVSYDARFLAENFAQLIAKVLLAKGLTVLLTEREAPIPAVNWLVSDRQAAGAIIVGVAAKPSYVQGLSYLPGTIDLQTKEINLAINNRPADLLAEPSRSKAIFERLDPRERYLAYLIGSIDRETIKDKKMKVVVDCLYGSVRGYFDLALQRLHCRVVGVNDYRDVLFGGEKTVQKELNLQMLQQTMAETKSDLGILFTENGDDLAVVGKKGSYASAKELLATFKENIDVGDSFLVGLKVVEAFAQQKLNLL